MPELPLDLPDHEIVARIRAGDAGVFERLFTTYWAPLCAFVTMMTRDQDDARELVADLFSALWERRADWAVTGSVQSYLFVAARNRARTAHRDAARRQALLQEQTDGADVLLHGQPLADDDPVAAQAEDRMTLDHAVAALPPRYQTAIYLRWRRDLDYDEIARVLDTTPAGAKKLVNRATALLRVQVRKRSDD